MYYVFHKTTGQYAGSGITEIDTDTHGSTNVEPPPYDTGTVVWTGSEWKPVSSNPRVVSPRQIRLALIVAGKDLAAIDAAIADNESARVQWEYATEVNRDDASLNQLAEQLGFTQDELDDLFQAARLL